jgi:putative phage-type endonuclease
MEIESVIEELIQILETPETPEPPYPENEIEQEMRQEIYHLIQLHLQEYPLGLSKPSYYQDTTQAILEAVYPLWEKEEFIRDHWKEEDIGQIIYEMVCEFCPARYTPFSDLPSQYEPDTPPTESDLQIWQQKIKTLEILDEQNPKQGSTAWLRQRYNMITASDAYKALSSPTQLYNIIKAKSQPFQCYGTEDEDGQRNQSHGPAAMAWGHMFEPVSVQIYEHLTNEKVIFMGCIPHPEIPFLGASPDGIVSPWETDGGIRQRTQRLLEIKNPISREIDGIPSEAYWIQQQIQMEVCDMEGCDFFETSFKIIDQLSIPNFYPLPQTSEPASSCLSSEILCSVSSNIDDHPPTQDKNPQTPPENEEPSLYYGVMVEYIYRKWGEPYPSTKRLYLPPYTTFTATSAISLFPLSDSEMSLEDTEDSESDTETEMSLEDTDEEETPAFQINETKTYVQNTETKEIFETPEQFLANIQAQIPKTHPEAPDYKFAKKVYWKLETASLVLVERNRHWFEAAKPRLQEAWEAIEQARQQLPPPPPILSTAPSQPITKTEKDIKTFFLPLS